MSNSVESMMIKDFLKTIPFSMALVYMLMPFVFDFAMSSNPELEPLWFMWSSPLSSDVAMFIFTALIAIGIISNGIVFMRRSKEGNGFDFNYWIPVILFVLGAIVSTMLVGVFVFGASVAALVSVGAEGSIVIIVASILTVICMYFFGKRNG